MKLLGDVNSVLLDTFELLDSLLEDLLRFCNAFFRTQNGDLVLLVFVGTWNSDSAASSVTKGQCKYKQAIAGALTGCP